MTAPVLVVVAMLVAPEPELLRLMGAPVRVRVLAEFPMLIVVALVVPRLIAP